MRTASWRLAALVLLVAGTTGAVPAASLDPSPLVHSRNSLQDVFSDCLEKGSPGCVKYKLFNYVDKMLGERDSFTLTEGVTVVRTPVADGAPRALLTPQDAQTQDVETMVLGRVQRFLETHTVKVDLKGADLLNAVSSAGRALGDTLGLGDDDADAQETGRKKIKKAGKTLLPLLLLLKLKLAALIPLALAGIGLLAGKALLLAKLALLLASIIALKKLLSHKQTVTYEIVSHPHHAVSHEHHDHHGGHDSFSSGGGDIGGSSYGGGGGGGHGGWGRSSDAQQLAYNSYQPQAKQ